MAKEELDALYQGGSETTWSSPLDSRTDWRIGREWIEQLVPMGSRILDVGCFDGGFLEPLVDSYQCSGIEIHQSASERAKQKGIEVIGSDFSEVTEGFDCITAFDVIEHVEQPMAFLDHCLAAVRPRGWVLVSTGNLDAFSFRMMGSRYWYCTIAEHISFLSPVWFRAVEQKGGCIVKRAMFAHGRASALRQLREAANNVLYRTNPWAFRTLRKLGFGGKSVHVFPELADHPPLWGSARDHFMVLVQKA